MCFSYDGKHPILDDISFSVNKGETIAFVGHTGSGKSSIMNLFLRFYDFKEGEIGRLIEEISNLEEDRVFKRHNSAELQSKIDS